MIANVDSCGRTESRGTPEVISAFDIEESNLYDGLWQALFEKCEDLNGITVGNYID